MLDDANPGAEQGEFALSADGDPDLPQWCACV